MLGRSAKAMKISTLQVEAGHRDTGWIEVVGLASGRPLSLPVVVIAGAQPGPTLGLVAGVHGDEFEGPAAIWRLSRELDPAALQGTLIGVPYANPSAFQASSRVNPLDGLNLNRVFPGSRSGAISEQIATTIMEEIVARCDALLDLHSGGQIMEILPLVMIGDPKDVGPEAAGLARATGLPVVWHADYPGTLAGAAVSRGTPALTLEVGGQARLDGTALTQMREAVLGVMGALNMLPQPKRSERRQRAVKGSFVTARAGGFFEAAVALGETVGEGQLLGTIRNPFGEEVTGIVTPASGLVCAVRTTPPVQPGGQLALVGAPVGA